MRMSKLHWLCLAVIPAYLVVDFVLPPAIFGLFGDVVAAQQSGNPSPGPIGIVSSNVAVCDPSNPMNCLIPAGGGPQVGARASGTTTGVTATLPAVVGKTNYVCGFSVSADGTGPVSPITVTGLVGGSMIFRAVTAPTNFTQTFTPCISASGPNASNSVATTADATATAVNVAVWGYTQ